MPPWLSDPSTQKSKSDNDATGSTINGSTNSTFDLSNHHHRLETRRVYEYCRF